MYNYNCVLVQLLKFLTIYHFNEVIKNLFLDKNADQATVYKLLF
jgi:hypothetical protein